MTDDSIEAKALALPDKLTDHQRGCAGRDYTCTCGYDDAVDNRIEAQEAEIERLRDALGYYAQELMTGPWGIDSLDFGDVARAALEQSK